MISIKFYTLKMVKEDGVPHEVPVIRSPAEVYQATKQLLALPEKSGEHFLHLMFGSKKNESHRNACYRRHQDVLTHQ